MALYLLDYTLRSNAYVYDTSDNSLEVINWGLFEECINKIRIEGVSMFNANKVSLTRVAPIQQSARISPDTRIVLDLEGIYFCTDGSTSKVILGGVANFISESNSVSDTIARTVWGNFFNANFINFRTQEEKRACANRLLSESIGVNARVEITLSSLTSGILGMQCRTTDKGVFIINKNVPDSQLWKVFVATGGKSECKVQIPNTSGVSLGSSVLGKSSNIKVADVWKYIYNLGY